MTKREQLQAEIIEKQRELISAYDEYSQRLLNGFNNESGGCDYPANEDDRIEKIKSELSALTTDLEKEGEDDETEQYEKCDVEGCDNVVTNGGVSWNKTGYWSTCSDHFSSSLRGDVQPSMKLSAIEREKSRDSKTGYLPSVKQVTNNRH